MSVRFALVLALALAPGWTLFAPALAQDLGRQEAEFIALVGRIRPSVVQVSGLIDGRELTWSGVVLDARGHIATAGRVLQLVERLRVTFRGRHAVAATRVGFDGVTSLGVIKVDRAALPQGVLRPVPQGDSASLRVGATAIVVGNPFGLTGSVSTGIISGKNRAIQTGGSLLTGMLQTTAPINPGDAGGLLADSRGRMVGIITSTFGRGMSANQLSGAVRRMLMDPDFQRRLRTVGELIARSGQFKDPQERMAFLIKGLKELEERDPGAGVPSAGFPGHGLSAEGINFVLPQAQVRRITADLIAHGRVRRGYLGVKLQMVREGDGDDARWLLVVEAVVENGPAARAGLRAGDILVAAGGRPLDGVIDLKSRLTQLAPGDALPLRLRRDATQHELVVTLGSND